MKCCGSRTEQCGTRFVRLSLRKRSGIHPAAQEDEPGRARFLGAEDPSQHETEPACLAAGLVLMATGA